eukprot:s2492_g3.t2
MKWLGQARLAARQAPAEDGDLSRLTTAVEQWFRSSPCLAITDYRATSACSSPPWLGANVGMHVVPAERSEEEIGVQTARAEVPTPAEDLSPARNFSLSAELWRLHPRQRGRVIVTSPRRRISTLQQSNHQPMGLARLTAED